MELIPSERTRVTSLLTRTPKYGAVIVCAPAGSGKTTAVRHYVSRSIGTTAYAELTAETSPETLEELLTADSSASEMVLDDIDKAPEATVNELVNRIRNNKSGTRYILVGRSRSRMRAHGLLATGSAASIDATALAFNNAEVGELAARLGSPYDDEAVAQLLHDTDGWAIAVAWIVRDAADAQRPLRGAFETWHERRGHILLEFLAAEYERDSAVYHQFKTPLRDGAPHSQGDLERFEALGFPVARTRASFRPYRILPKLARNDAESPENSRSDFPLLTFNVLGRFRCQLGGVDVTFQRRRDRNVFTYVALAPEGRATREQLLQAFWADTNRALATQGLRTTLSRIRSALAQVVGLDAVERYFYSADDIRVDLSKITFDVRRFSDHFQRGHMDDTRDDAQSAKYHYAAAARLYRDRLLASESIEPCFFAQRDELERKFVEALERLVQLYTAEANYDAARTCASKLAERTTHVNSRLSATIA